MAVDESHEGCFAMGSRLYAVPSDSTFTVAETKASYTDAAAIRRRTRGRLHWSAYVGGVLGGLFIDLSAWHASKVTDWVALGMMFGLGGIVGFATSIGIRQAFVGHTPETAVIKLPAIEIPSDVARNAPEDASADELVLWSVITRRFRAAKVAVENLPFEAAPSFDVTATEASGSARSGTVLPAASPVLAELTYVTARHDFEPVAELLGLPVPR
jgi:hypothetical protein